MSGSHHENHSFVHASVDELPHKVAIVIPYIGVQTWKFLVNWKTTWQEFPPCGTSNALRKPFEATLFLYLDQPFSKSTVAYDGAMMQELLTAQWKVLSKQGNFDQCFQGGIQFLDIDAGVLGHLDGSCVMYYNLYQKLENRGFHHYLLMEPDVTPVQSNWLNRLTYELNFDQKCSQFWVKGSNSRCAATYGGIKERNDYHINGNALYCLGSSRFREFREQVQQLYPPGSERMAPIAAGCGTGREYEMGFDHAQYQTLMHKDLFEYTKHLRGKFVYTDFIQNRCQGNYDANKIVLDEPSTHLVHSAWVFKDKEQAQVEEVFNLIFGNFPRAEEIIKYKTKLQMGELNPDQLAPAICGNQGLFKMHPKCKTFEEQYYNELTNWSERFPNQFYVWTSDFHSGPIICNMHIFRQLGMVIHAEVDHGHCVYNQICKDRLKVLANDDWRGFSLNPCPQKMRKNFYETYRNDPEMNRVDIITCSHPAANCELYMPLNKTLIVYVTTRLEFGRHDEEIDWEKPYTRDAIQIDTRWREWLHNLKTIALSPRSVLAANNWYDKKYVEYFTGLKVEYLPSLCAPTKNAGKLQYAPYKRQILIGPARDNLDLGPTCRGWNCDAEKHPLMIQLRAAISNDPMVQTQQDAIFVCRIRDLYKKIDMQDVLSHRAMILFPYQSSTMFAIEMYRAGVPMLAPTQRFLKEWHLKYNYLFERIYGKPPHDIHNYSELPYPNHPTDELTLDVWLSFFDIYQWEHIVYFDSFEELVYKLHTTNFEEVHNLMMQYNQRFENILLTSWRKVLHKANLFNPGEHKLANPQLSLNQNLNAIYGDNNHPIWPVQESNDECKSDNKFIPAKFEIPEAKRADLEEVNLFTFNPYSKVVVRKSKTPSLFGLVLVFFVLFAVYILYQNKVFIRTLNAYTKQQREYQRYKI